MKVRQAAGYCLPAVLWLISLCAPVWAADWPRFRGPNGSGVAETSGLPASFGPDTNVVWKTSIPAGYSSPVLTADRLFLTAVENEKLYTLCLSRRTGELLWKRECSRPRTEKLDQRNHPAAATPAVDGDNLVVFFGDFGLVSYDLDGKERWRTPLGPFNNSYGMGASPIIVDDLVVLVCDQRNDSFIIALDKETGAPRWRRPRTDAVSGHSTPVIHQADGSAKTILTPGSFRLDAYSPTTGESLWWVYGLPSEMKSVPILNGDTLYVAGYNVPINDAGQQITVPPFAQALGDYDADGNGKVARDELPKGRLQQLVGFSDRDRDGGLDADEWRLYAAAQASENGLRAIKLGGRGDTTTTSLTWKYPKSVPQLPSPLLYRDVVYMVNDGGILTMLRPEGGDLIKQMRLSGAVDHYFASPVAADEKVFFVSQAGAVTVLRAGPEPEILSVNELGEETYATPAIADGNIYIRTAGTLYCFGNDR